ncbi:hypothetical protein [Pseudocnuella soli]|uniref:hypothetical protein n=1 Tax=Pseudocnuella soli TaxID=2502779 RepID=UPI00195E3FBA|nr:hypothetical protein [Pseudocnuella soli]
MRTFTALMICAILLSACSANKRAQGAKATEATSGNTRTKEVVFLDEQSYKLEELATDKTYGYSQSNPVKVGGKFLSGVANERRFLNGLAGPGGEQVQYKRRGSCCGFKTPNGFDNVGMLDIYKVYWEGCKDTAILYLNMYDEGDLQVPVGLKPRS